MTHTAFPRPFSRSLVAALALAAVSPLAAAQVLDRAIPEAAAPGDVVILRGSGLGGTTSVHFTAQLGGFVIYTTKSVAPLLVSDTQVLAIVPAFTSLHPPSGFHPTAGSPFGAVSLTPAAGDTAFYLMEATFGALTTPGVGTTQASGIGKPVVSFSLFGLLSLPVPGSPGFELRLENATPGSFAFAGVSLPVPPPYLPIGDGEIVLYLPTLQIIGTGEVNAFGDLMILVAIPPAASGVHVLQWGLVEAGSGTLAVSNGLQVVL